jgi:coniferyl-aldehyde dehydrogenase
MAMNPEPVDPSVLPPVPVGASPPGPPLAASPPASPLAAPVDPLTALRARLEAVRPKDARAPTYAERIEHLRALEATILTEKSALAAAVSADFGNRSKVETYMAEVFVVVEGIRYILKNLREWMEPERRATSWAFLPGSSRLVYQPLGVVGVISPWNYPVQLAFAPMAGALAAGNRVMLKPSELTPRTSDLLAELLGRALPRPIVDTVVGGPDVGEAFSRLPFDHLVFTGSTRVGKLVMRAAAENLVPVTLELGGKSPTLVMPDFGLDVAAERISFGKLINAGQTCIAPDYVLVPKGQAEAFATAAERAIAKMFPTLEDNGDYTSIVSDRHYERLVRLLAEAEAAGAKLWPVNPAREALPAHKRKLAPTFVIGARDDLGLMQEEIFGPVLPIVEYGSLDEAIRYVNARPRPLALYVFSHKTGDLDRVLDETISGGVAVNDTLLHIAQDDLPFGGVGPSGMGHYHAREGFEAFSKKKPIFTQARLNAISIMHPPYGKLVDRFVRAVLGK